MERAVVMHWLETVINVLRTCAVVDLQMGGGKPLCHQLRQGHPNRAKHGEYVPPDHLLAKCHLGLRTGPLTSLFNQVL